MIYYTYMATKQNDKIREELGNKLREAREKAGLTQADVASKTDMHVNYYARIERGEINTSFEKLHKIAEVLKVKIL
jgi:transcriptional regulator with XRE-family HTH domain